VTRGAAFDDDAITFFEWSLTRAILARSSTLSILLSHLPSTF